MAINYSNATYIDLSKLNTDPNITVNISGDWTVFEAGVQSIFSQFSWLEVAQSIGVFAALYVLFSNQKILNLTNMQVVLAASFFTIFFNVGMLYAKYFTSFYMLGTFFIIWLVALIMTIRD